MIHMQLTHLRRADLNLLPALMVLLEERQVSKAAQRFHLSQPAMSRVLARLRETFADELLIRTTKGYELTAKARRLHDELPGVLGELDRIMRGDAFDPAKSTNAFRIGCPDHASLAFAPVLAERMAREAPLASLEIVAWNEESFADVTRGQLDMVIWANEVPAPLESLELHEDEMVCVLSADHPLGKGRLTLERYVAFPHVHVTVKAERRHSIAQQLVGHGVRRRIGLRVPYFSAAVLAVIGTPLIATVPRWAVRSYESDARIRVVAPPIVLEHPRYLIAWHPRMTADPAHRWFRSVMIDAAAELTESTRR